MLNANRDEYKGKTYASQQAHQDICKGKKKTVMRKKENKTLHIASR